MLIVYPKNFLCTGRVVNLPEAMEFTKGDAPITIPANKTLYKEGFTLTAWTDGASE